VEIYKKNGELVTVEISARPLKKDGKIIGDLAILRDVTERKRSEEALKASEQNFRNSIDSSLMGILIVDEKWHTLYANQVFLDIFGYKNIDEVSASVLQDHYTP
jgi:PAS domain-containing protein